MKNAQHKYICICVDVNEIVEGGDFNENFECLSKSKVKKVKIKKENLRKIK